MNRWSRIWKRMTLRAVTISILAGVSLALPVAAQDKVLRVAVADWVPGLGNPYASTMNGTLHPFAGMFDALTALGSDGTVQPNLALSWEAVTPLRWVFKLRPGVQFANGEPVNASAFVAMFNWLKGADAQRYVLASEAKGIVTAEAVDDLTLAITTQTPDVLLPRRMSVLLVVPPAYWAKIGVDAFVQAPIGSGPFQLQTWGRAKGRTVLIRNPTAWRPATGVDQIELVILPENARRTQALMTGEADLAFNIDFEGREQLKQNGIQTIVRQVPVVSALALPNTRANSPMNDVRVRQALNYAVDRASIARIILAGTVQPAGQGAAPGVFGYDPTIQPYPYDPDKARALLAAAGVKLPLNLTASVIGKSIVEGETIFQFVAQGLAAVGVNLEIRNVTGTDWVKMWVSGDWRGADMLSSVWNGATFMDASRAVEPFMCTKAGAFFCDAETDQLVIASNATFDISLRERLLQKALNRFHDLAPSLYLFAQPELIGVVPRVGNITYRGRYIDWSTVDLTP